MSRMFESGWNSTLVPLLRRKRDSFWMLLTTARRTQIRREKTCPNFAQTGQPSPLVWVLPKENFEQQGKEGSMAGFSHCVQCGRRLRNAFFCSECGQALCGRRCLDQ